MEQPGHRRIQEIVLSLCRPYGCVSVLGQTHPEGQRERAPHEESAARGSRSVSEKPGLIVQVILMLRMFYYFKKIEHL